MSEQRRNRAGYRSALDRLDERIRRGGERLAGRGGLSRRGLLETVGLSAAAAGILSQRRSDHEQAVGWLPAGCFGTEDVNVCYTPWIVTRAEPGRTDGVVLRKGPSFSADPVTRTD